MWPQREVLRNYQALQWVWISKYQQQHYISININMVSWTIYCQAGWDLSLKVKEAYISAWNIAKQWSELIDTIYYNSDDMQDVCQSTNGNSLMMRSVFDGLLKFWRLVLCMDPACFGPSCTCMLFQLALARYSLFRMMKLVVASQNILLDSTGIYGCHEKLSFTWRLFHATHKFQCLTKLWLLKDTVGCYSFSAGKQWTHVPANSVAFDLVLHLLSIRPLAIIGTFSVTFEVTVLPYHV